MIINDHIFTELICNLRCTYCPCETNLMKKDGNLLKISSYDDAFTYEESVSKFIDRNRKIIRQSRYRKKTPILKVSGGEIFLIPEFMDILPLFSREYAVIQILTNGILFTPTIVKRLQKFPNIHLQISLDGHTTKMNSYRFQNPKILTTILDNIVLVSDANIPLEINCVLTKINIEDFFNFVETMNHRVRECIIYPFPVRLHPELFPRPEQIDFFAETLKNKFPLVKHLLPPIQYLNSLIEFMRAGKRTKGCYIPYIVLATHGNGQLEFCTCGSIKILGNVLSNNPYKEIGHDPCYNNVVNPDLSPLCCRDCFTHYDILNLFLEKRISVAELKAMPFFAASEVINKLIAMRKEIIRG